MAISWFWFLGATYLTQFPNFTKIYLNGTESAVSFLLAIFSIGIALGSQVCDKLSGHRIEIGIVPIGSLGITVFGFLMAYSIPDSLPHFTSLYDFVSYTSLWPVFLFLLLLGASGGVFIVPLYALIQHRSKVNQRAQIIAALNIYNALYMVGSAVLAIVALSVLELTIPQLFIAIAVVNFLITLFLCYQVPIFLVRFVLWILTHTIYKVKHKNLHHLPEEGGALIVCNHVSYMDALLLSAICPRLIRFVMEEDYANFKPLQRFYKRAGVIPISANNKSSIRAALKSVDEALQNGELVCIFPEGHLTSDGEIQEFRRGVELILRKASSPVIPMALKGMWGSYFSRYKGRACKGVPTRFRAEIEIEASAPIHSTETSLSSLKEVITQLRGDWR